MAIDITTPAAAAPVFTAEEKAFETQGVAIDGRLRQIDFELEKLQNAAARIADLEAEKAALVAQKSVIDPKRSSRPSASLVGQIT